MLVNASARLFGSLQVKEFRLRLEMPEYKKERIVRLFVNIVRLMNQVRNLWHGCYQVALLAESRQRSRLVMQDARRETPDTIRNVPPDPGVHGRDADGSISSPSACLTAFMIWKREDMPAQEKIELVE